MLKSTLSYKNKKFIYEISTYQNEITESIEKYLGLLSTDEIEEFLAISNKTRQKEFVGVRILLSKLVRACGMRYQGLYKNKNGKPHLINYPSTNISITHSNGYLGAALSQKRSIGIDLQTHTLKAFQLKNKFLNLKDNFCIRTSTDATRLWTIKEAAYKALTPFTSSSPHFYLRDIIVKQKKETVNAHFRGSELNIYHETNDKYSLAIALI